MPTNTLDLFVTERVQQHSFSVFDSNGNCKDFLVDFNNDNFSTTEFARLQILFNCNFRVEPPDWYHSRSEIDLIYFIQSVYRSQRHQDYDLIIKFIKTMYLCDLVYCVDEFEFVHKPNNDYYVLLDDETFATEEIPVCCRINNCLWVVLDSDGNEGYSATEEYVCCNDVYYINSDVAESHGFEYRTCCDDYYHEDVVCCDEHHDGSVGCEFDYTYNGLDNKPTYLNLTKTSSMQYTFGVELETCDSSNVKSNPRLNVKSVRDGSTNGLEYVSGVLHGNNGVNMISEICEHLTCNDAKVDRSCGVHVHVGNAMFNRRFSIMVLKLCLDIENDIYKLLPDSRQGNTYCKKLPKNLIERMNFHNYKDTLGEIIQNSSIDKNYNKKKTHPGGHYNSQRYYWVNITNYSTSTGPNTIEFRPHSGSLDFKKIYNWLLICMSIVKFAENQQRRIWTSGMSKHSITLNEVLKYSLNQKLYNQVFDYCKTRAKRFGNNLI
tara:strand:+ start:1993 stop:3465 length:1473 start_codon:yes stop_codon:yes gene_type:complete